jgi:hypothetical protein|tara:strand:- start:1156 stop:1638 length:483 start_codon:yes stop_codon:yes gene_type:complete
MNKPLTNTVEIDSDVMDILKQNAEPLVDTPNMVLRRLLGIDKKTELSYNDFPPISEFIPKSLIQILEVIFLVIAEGYSRNQATNFIAEKYSIYPQTVMDKYSRQLNMTSNEIEKLLDNSNIGSLKEKLTAKFGKYSVDVDQYFKHIKKKSIDKSWGEISV